MTASKACAVLAQRDLAVGAAVDVVEDDARNPAARGEPKVLDVHDPLGSHVERDFLMARKRLELLAVRISH